MIDNNYVDVATRIAEFRALHPEGSLQPANPSQPYRIEEIVGTERDGKEVRQTFIVYAAAAYRTPDDPRPGIGLAYEVFPGRTNFTRGSELMNAETSAWGRAILAVLAADSRKGVASSEEVRNRVAEREQATQQPRRPAKISDLDKAEAERRSIPAEQARQERLEQERANRDLLGTKSDGRARDQGQVERSTGPAQDDPWAS